MNMLLVNGSQQSNGFLPKGLKLSDYRLLEDDRKHVRVWAEGVVPWLKLVNLQLLGTNEHYACILYLA
jgi:hypothetical protein